MTQAQKKEFDPGTLSQEQLMNFMERLLMDESKKYKRGTRERAAYDAAFGLVVSTRGSWFRRMLGRIIKRSNEQNLLAHDIRDLRAQLARSERDWCRALISHLSIDQVERVTRTRLMLRDLDQEHE